MKKRSLKIVSLLVSSLMLSLFSNGFANANTFVTIGTAGVTGVYYPIGGGICRLVNKERKEHGIRCSVESTAGSVYNIDALREGSIQMGVIQSDIQYDAYLCLGSYQNDCRKELRSLFSIHPESLTLMVNRNSNINSLDDIKGKRVNIGNQGSGQRAMMEAIFAQKGWSASDFKLLTELRPSEQAQALCNNNIDVAVFSAGHPNGVTQEATSTCGAKIISSLDKDVEGLITKYPYYSFATIPGGMYPGNPDDIRTFGVRATFVTTSNASESDVYNIVKSVFENFDIFKTLHPVFANLDPKDLVFSGNTAPLHDGARKYFIEAGYIKK